VLDTEVRSRDGDRLDQPGAQSSGLVPNALFDLAGDCGGDPVLDFRE
jgi:hypothetical protein